MPYFQKRRRARRDAVLVAKLSDVSPESDIDDRVLEMDRVTRIFVEIGTAERHFNTVESSYRALASTWLLSVFAGVGFVLTSNPSGISLDPLLLAAAISAVGIVGITMLWYIDLFVYHRLLDCWFEQGLALEQRYDWLPAVRRAMMERTNLKGVVPRVSWFYATAVIILTALGGCTVSIWAARFGAIWAVGSGFLILVFSGSLVLIIRRNPAVPRFERPGSEHRAAIP